MHTVNGFGIWSYVWSALKCRLLERQWVYTVHAVNARLSFVGDRIELTLVTTVSIHAVNARLSLVGDRIELTLVTTVSIHAVNARLSFVGNGIELVLDGACFDQLSAIMHHWCDLISRCRNLNGFELLLQLLEVLVDDLSMEAVIPPNRVNHDVHFNFIVLICCYDKF